MKISIKFLPNRVIDKVLTDDKIDSYTINYMVKQMWVTKIRLTDSTELSIKFLPMIRSIHTQSTMWFRFNRVVDKVPTIRSIHTQSTIWFRFNRVVDKVPTDDKIDSYTINYVV